MIAKTGDDLSTVLLLERARWRFAFPDLVLDVAGWRWDDWDAATQRAIIELGALAPQGQAHAATIAQLAEAPAPAAAAPTPAATPPVAAPAPAPPASDTDIADARERLLRRRSGGSALEGAVAGNALVSIDEAARRGDQAAMREAAAAGLAAAQEAEERARADNAATRPPPPPPLELADLVRRLGALQEQITDVRALAVQLGSGAPAVEEEEPEEGGGAAE